MSPVTDAPETTGIRVGRQPIFDAGLEVIGYELLYRATDSATSCTADSHTASAAVVVNAMLDFGLDTLTGGALAFVNCASSTWDQELFELLPKERVVLEVLEDALEDGVDSFIQKAKELGYRIALDDVASSEDRASLLPYADIVKLELPAFSPDQLIDITRENHNSGRKVLAEKVETREDFEAAKSAGCDYFQGYFFARPATLTSERTLPPSHVQSLQLLSDLSDESRSADDVSKKVACDVGLSLRILKYANSAAVGARTKIESIQRAVLMVGFDTLRKWAQVIALSGLASDKPTELMRTALLRARFCEMVASRGSGSHPAAFTVGLLSLLDAMLDRPLVDSFAELQLVEEVESALVAREGELGNALALAIAYEQFDWEQIGTLSRDDEPTLSTDLSDWFVDAMTQAQTYYSLSKND